MSADNHFTSDRIVVHYVICISNVLCHELLVFSAIHKFSFVGFVILSQLYMILSLVLFNWGHSHSGWSEKVRGIAGLKEQQENCTRKAQTSVRAEGP